MKVFITRRFPEAAAEFLKKKKITVSVHKGDNPPSHKELIKNAKDADGIITLLSDRIDKYLIDQLRNCKVIANYAVGYNNIDIEYAKKKNIIVTNTPDILTDATADIALGLALACARHFSSADRFMRDKKFTGWKPSLYVGIELKNKVFGIIGAGRIGTAVALRAKAFGCKIVYYSRSRYLDFESKTEGKKLSLNKLLEVSDFISLHIPLTSQTYHLLDRERLSLLKPTAILINTARGEVVDEKALITLLKKKKIFAAGFDVYENEPKINEDLLNLENVVLLPHIGSATFDARNGMALLAARNVHAVLSGKPPLTPVN